jgi:hypothetical protein
MDLPKESFAPIAVFVLVVLHTTCIGDNSTLLRQDSGRESQQLLISSSRPMIDRQMNVKLQIMSLWIQVSPETNIHRHMEKCPVKRN